MAILADARALHAQLWGGGSDMLLAGWFDHRFKRCPRACAVAGQNYFYIRSRTINLFSRHLGRGYLLQI